MCNPISGEDCAMRRNADALQTRHVWQAKAEERERKSEDKEAAEGEVEQASLQDLASFACETKKGVNPNPRISQMARNHAIADAASEACCRGKSNAAAAAEVAQQLHRCRCSCSCSESILMRV